MAKSIGFPKHLIDRSLDYLGKQEYLFSSLVRSLKKEKEEVEKEKEEILRLKASLSEKIREIEDKKAEVQRKIEEEFRSKVNAIEAQIEEIEREIAKRDRVSIGRAKEMLEGLKREVKVENLDKKGEEELKVGDLVRIKSLGSIGYISDLPDDSGQYEVVIGNIRTRIKRAKLEKVSDRIGNLYVKDSPDVKVFSEKVDDWKLNIRGMSVDEALESLDRFMDKAILNGVNKIRILHGIGTGKLTSKVREYLSKSTYVTSFRLDDKNPGITIVELK
jgi:DNA mismatch repair protein MutS2